MLHFVTFPMTPEEMMGALAILGLSLAVIIAVCMWLFACPRTPDPWGAEIESAVEGEEAALPLAPVVGRAPGRQVVPAGWDMFHSTVKS